MACGGKGMTLQIVNYCDRRCAPFQSITRLGREDALRLAESLAQNRTEAFTSFSRFARGDFIGYYALRLRTEAWLHARFVAQGGRPRTAHPLYFVLGKSDYLRGWYQEGEARQLALDAIAPCDISFTIGDSMSQMDRPGRLDLMTKDTLFAHIEATGQSPAAFLAAMNEKNRYVEVQLWNDEYVLPFLAQGAEEA